MNVFSVIMMAELALGTQRLLPHPKLSAILIWAGWALLHYVWLIPSGRLDPADRIPSVRTGTAWRLMLYPLASVAIFLALLGARSFRL